jgi:hypothetical protein
MVVIWGLRFWELRLGRERGSWDVDVVCGGSLWDARAVGGGVIKGVWSVEVYMDCPGCCGLMPPGLGMMMT